MSEERQLTAREKAVKAIQAGESVVVNGVQYTLTGNPDTRSRPLSELPGDEVFAAGDEQATQRAMQDMKKQMADLQARYDALSASKKEAKASVKVEEKTESNK